LRRTPHTSWRRACAVYLQDAGGGPGFLASRTLGVAPAPATVRWRRAQAAGWRKRAGNSKGSGIAWRADGTAAARGDIRHSQYRAQNFAAAHAVLRLYMRVAALDGRKVRGASLQLGRANWQVHLRTACRAPVSTRKISEAAARIRLSRGEGATGRARSRRRSTSATALIKREPRQNARQKQRSRSARLKLKAVLAGVAGACGKGFYRRIWRGRGKLALCEVGMDGTCSASLKTLWLASAVPPPVPSPLLPAHLSCTSLPWRIHGHQKGREGIYGGARWQRKRYGIVSGARLAWADIMNYRLLFSRGTSAPSSFNL